MDKVRKKSGKLNLSVKGVIAFYITILTLGRCLKINYVFFIIGIMAIILMGIDSIKRKIWISYSMADVAVILMIPLLFINNRLDSMMQIVFYIISFLSYFVFRESKEYFKGVAYGLIFFSILNLVVNFFNLLSSQGYMSLIRSILSNVEANSAIKAYTRYGHLCGLSGHYSRNAYFCVVGFSVVCSVLLSGKSKRNGIWTILALVMVGMTMLIGKRAHFLFMCASFLVVYELMGNTLTKKMKRLLVFGLAGSIFLVVIIRIFPSVNYVFKRFIDNFNSGDISNGRIKLYEEAFSQFLNNPILGIGFGNFTLNSYDYFGYQYAGVHNDYLQWLCETGIVGFIINLFFMIYIYRLSIIEMQALISEKNIKRKEELFLIVWSVLFQTFIILYSFTGIPHYDREVFPIYYVACSIPHYLINKLPNYSKKIKKRLIRFR